MSVPSRWERVLSIIVSYTAQCTEQALMAQEPLMAGCTSTLCKTMHSCTSSQTNDCLERMMPRACRLALSAWPVCNGRCAVSNRTYICLLHQDAALHLLCYSHFIHCEDEANRTSAICPTLKMCVRLICPLERFESSS